jgi:PAS domain S-box-containing protein
MFNLTHHAFADFIEKLPVAVACLDENRCYFALNKACVEINGVSYEQTIGKAIGDVVPDLESTLTPIFDKIYLHGGEIKNTLVEGKTPASDKTRYWLASYQPLPLDNGKTGLLVTAEEVTQQIFATKSAEKNRKLLTDVLDSLFTFVGLLDPKGVLLDANKAPLEAAGISLEDVEGKLFWDCVWWTYSSASQQRIKQAVIDVQNNQLVRFDIDVQVASGLMAIDFMMKGLYSPDGTLTHIIASAIDISERKIAEDALLLSETRFKTVINRTVDGLVVFDSNGIINLANKRFEELVERG